MKTHSKLTYSASDILEALTESLSEIDTQFKKVKQLKSLLEGSSRKLTSPHKFQGSYAEKYKKTDRKHTSSMSTLPLATVNGLKRTVSKPDLSEHLKVGTYLIPETEETEYFIEEREKSIKSKAQSTKAEENKIKSIENELYSLEISVENSEKVINTNERKLKKQISESFCRGLVHELILRVQSKITSQKTAKISKEKLLVKSRATEVNNSIAEIARIKKSIEMEFNEHEVNTRKFVEKEAEIDSVIQRISSDSRIIQQSKHESTIRVKEEQLRVKESSCIERLKAINKRKGELEVREQKLEVRERISEAQRTSSKSPTKDENSVREKKLNSKEKALKELEENIQIEEQEVENKRKEVMDKWEKMISKLDDINKQEHKSSFTNQELDEKYKEFNVFNSEIERKLAKQQASLENQEAILLKKIKSLEEKSMLLVEREEKLKVEEHFLSEQAKSQKKPLKTEVYLSSESHDEEFATKFLERQTQRKKELEQISKEKEALSSTLSGFLSELN